MRKKEEISMFQCFIHNEIYWELINCHNLTFVNARENIVIIHCLKALYLQNEPVWTIDEITHN